MKINSLWFLVLSWTFAFNVHAADEGDVTNICLDGQNINQNGLFNTSIIGRWLDRDHVGQRCELTLLENIGPIYPERAFTGGVEGRVKVSFTVTELGLVIDAKVIGADPVEIFDLSAIRAAELLRFEPRVVNGKAVAVENVQHVFNYDM